MLRRNRPVNKLKRPRGVTKTLQVEYPKPVVPDISADAPGPSRASGQKKTVADDGGRSEPVAGPSSKRHPTKAGRSSTAKQDSSQPKRKRLKKSGEGGEKITEATSKRTKDKPRLNPGVAVRSRKKGTTIRFPPVSWRERVERRRGDSSSDEFDLDQPGIRESLEICEGFSKIKLEDWYPFYDVQHHKRYAQDTVPEQTTEEQAKNGDDDDDEWEESLVYLDLEDIPDVDGLFSSLAPRRPKNDTAVDEPPSMLAHLEMRIFQMDSDLPVIQLGGKYLAGKWEHTTGTSLFFKKKSDEDCDGEVISSSPPPADSTLKNIAPQPEIMFDQVFGESQIGASDGYELVAKSFKVLKTRYFPVVTDIAKKGDVRRESDDEYDPREFQIPPLNMVRQHLTPNFHYGAYVNKDVRRRKQIRRLWSKEHDPREQPVVVKSEPLDTAAEEEACDNVEVVGGESILP